MEANSGVWITKALPLVTLSGMSGTSSKQRSAILLAVLVIGSVVTGGMVVMAQDAPGDDDSGEIDTQQTTYLRVMHASPDAPAVDVYIDNESALTNVSFGDLSEYQTLAAGEHNVTVTAADDEDSVVFEGPLILEPRMAQTLAVTGELTEDGVMANETDDGIVPNESANETAVNETEDVTNESVNGDNASSGLEAVTLNDNAFEPREGNAALSIVRFSSDAPAVDITTANGTVLAAKVSYHEATDYVTVPAGNYTVEIRAA
ncbi:MAG: DUF4397 domain-containing protein, partial [archaeon]